MASDTHKTAVPLNSKEMAHLEYGLQLALHATTARVTGAQSLANPNTQLQFDNQTQGDLVVTAWVDVATLTAGNTEEDVVKRGFQFGAHAPGRKFVVGDLPSVKDRETHPIQRAIMCKIGVGRSWPVDEEQLGKAVLPEGYKSFYVRKAGRKDAPSGDVYHHEYYIQNAAQILPLYLVQYEYNPLVEQKSREKASCDNCEKQLATIYCHADSANLCGSCDAQLHASKLASRHVRHPIGQGVDLLGRCRLHPEKTIEFFCSQCAVPVCVYCKMVGNHATGDAAKHPLVSVAEAHASVMKEAALPDPIFQSRRATITSQLSAISSRAQAVTDLAGRLQQQIDALYREASTQLKRHVHAKITTLQGDEIEYLRQLGEINRLERFCDYVQEGDPTQFLFIWGRHQDYRAALHDFKQTREGLDVNLDLQVTGKIAVEVDSLAPVGGPRVLHHTHHHHHPPAVVAEIIAPAADGGSVSGVSAPATHAYSGAAADARSGGPAGIAAPGSGLAITTGATGGGGGVAELTNRFANAGPHIGVAGHPRLPPKLGPHHGGAPSARSGAPTGLATLGLTSGSGVVGRSHTTAGTAGKAAGIQRRTSDFFSETLGAFDTMNEGDYIGESGY